MKCHAPRQWLQHPVVPIQPQPEAGPERESARKASQCRPAIPDQEPAGLVPHTRGVLSKYLQKGRRGHEVEEEGLRSAPPRRQVRGRKFSIPSQVSV